MEFDRIKLEAVPQTQIQRQEAKAKLYILVLRQLIQKGIEVEGRSALA
jgi:hypothetical protein